MLLTRISAAKIEFSSIGMAFGTVQRERRGTRKSVNKSDELPMEIIVISFLVALKTGLHVRKQLSIGQVLRGLLRI